MCAKPSSSTVSLKTLKGFFERPKMNHRRDFLRENKLSLRELQKNTNQKLTQQREELEYRKNRFIQKVQKSQEQTPGRRSASQCRITEQHCKRQSRITAGAEANAGKEQTNKLVGRRAYSQQRPKEQTSSQNSGRRKQLAMPRSASNLTSVSKALSCDKEIQTEEIRDQDFLYKALKKCSSGDSDPFTTENFNLQQAHVQQNEAELKPLQADHILQSHNEDNNQIAQKRSEFDNYSIIDFNAHAQENVKEASVKENLEQDFQNFNIVGDMKRETEQHSSARSRQTICSTANSYKGGYKLGGREDVHLPRYLEKEKREKEEERIRKLNQDHNCPTDHYALSEEERTKALHKSQQKMVSLIKELNLMPMTMETLRIRTRKAEIEKELRKVELDIRLYSKSKVYMPC